MVYEGHLRLGDLFESRREKGRPGLPLLSVTMNDGLVDRDDLDRKQETSLAPHDHLLVKPGDIAYNMMRMWQGACGLCEAEAQVSPAYVVLRPRAGVDPLYASFLFKSSRMKYLFWAYSYGLTDDRLRLYPKDFNNIPVTVPALEEQKHIGASLSTWDRGISAVESEIRAMAKLKLEVARILLSGSKRIDGNSTPWKPTRIGDMGRVFSGGTPDSEDLACWNGNIRWATPTDFTRKIGRHLHDTARQLTAEGLRSSSAHLLPKDSILVCTRATVGEVAIAANDMATNQGFKNLVLYKGYCPDFVYHLFDRFKDRFIRLACGSTFLELSKKDFERIEFQVPSLEEQRAIAERLNCFDERLTALEKYRECLEKERDELTNMQGYGEKTRRRVE